MASDDKSKARGSEDREVPRPPIMVGPGLGQLSGKDRTKEEMAMLAEMADAEIEEIRRGMRRVEKPEQG